nr:importin subunit alpha-2-like [Ipomoea batatas]
MSPRPNARVEVRRNRYRVARDAGEGRRMREDNMVDIRKNRREESLQKKRRQGLEANQQFPLPVQSEKKLDALPAMVAGLRSDDGNLQLQAATQFRNLLSIERSPPVDEVIQAGVVPRFVQFLARADFPQLQFQAAWVLTNIASGTSEHTRVVIESGAVPIFVKLLSSPSDDVREQAVWALGNVAGDSPKCRDLVLSSGALSPLLAQLNANAKLSMLRNATWALSNCCRGKPQPPFEQTRPALPALQQLIHSTDEEVVTDACWALSYLSDGTHDKIQAVIDSGVCSRLVELLQHPSSSVNVPALRAVGNIVTGDDMQTQLDTLPAMVAGVRSDDGNLQLEATTQFRKLLSIERSPPVDEVIQAGVVPRFVQFLARDDFPQLQFQAAWVLTNIASGTSEHTRVVIESGAVPIFVKLLSSPSDDVREQAVWALGNVAGDSPKCRDLVLSSGALSPLLAQLNANAKLSMLRNATWALSNCCRGKPQPPFEQTRPALPALQQLIHSTDEEVVTDACWALSYLSDGTHDKIQAVIDSGVCSRLVELLQHPSSSIILPALRAVGNIVTGDGMQIQHIIDNQGLYRLSTLLTGNYNKSIKKEACWTISKITAGSTAQIQAVIGANIFGPLVNLLQNGEFDIKKEAAWAISNATSGGSHDQIKYLVHYQGCIKPLCDLLVCPDPRIVMVCLEGLENILKVGEAEKNTGRTGDLNLYADMVVDVDGLEKIENLQRHDNPKIYEKVVKILEGYWLEVEDETAAR